jgi:hypothetical protein
MLVSYNQEFRDEKFLKFSKASKGNSQEVHFFLINVASLQEAAWMYPNSWFLMS